MRGNGRIILGGLGLAVVGVAAFLYAKGPGSDRDEPAVEPAVAEAPAVAPASERETAIGTAFRMLRIQPLPAGGVTFGELMAAERACLGQIAGQAPSGVAWAAYERTRLFMAAMRYGGEVGWAPDGTERFRGIVEAIGPDPSAALQAGRITLADVQFAESYIETYLRDTGTRLYDGLELDADAKADLAALVETRHSAASRLETCVRDTVKTTHGVDLDADRRAEATAD